MPGKDQIDWEAADTMQDKETMFLLYTVFTGLCRHVDDFSRHFEGSIEEEVQTLVTAGFLEKVDGRLGITERGRFVLGDLADAAGNKEAQAQIDGGSWIADTNSQPRVGMKGKQIRR